MPSEISPKQLHSRELLSELPRDGIIELDASLCHDAHMTMCSMFVSRNVSSLAQDLFALRIRQQRPHILFHQQRNFRTRTPPPQLSTTTPPPNDESFIPFKLDSDVSHTIQRTSATRDDISQGEKDTEKSLDDDWHAEIELIAPRPEKAQAYPQAYPLEEHKAATGVWNTECQSKEQRFFEERDQTVDRVSFPALDVTSTQSDATPPSLITHIAPIASATSKTISQEGTSDARMRRKLRRMEAGKYPVSAGKTEAVGQEDGKLVGDQVATVLGKIKALSGPSAKSTPVPGHQLKQASKKQAEARSKNQKKEDEHRQQPLTKREAWQVQKHALESKFGEDGWQPRKRLSPDTMDGIRALHASDPSSYTTATLSEHFQVSSEAVRRILKSKWRPTAEDAEDRRLRWERRGVRKWEEMAQQGARPPAKWRALGVQSLKARATGRYGKGEGQGDRHVRWDQNAPSSESLAERIL